MKKYPENLSSVEVEKELGRERYKNRYKRTIRSTFSVLIIAAALAVLVATLWMPVLQIYGASMVPTLQEGEIVVSIKNNDFKPGDIVAFYYGNKFVGPIYVARRSRVNRLVMAHVLRICFLF